MEYQTRASGFIVPRSASADLAESGASRELRERIAELEYSSGNDDGDRWLPMAAAGEALEFSRGFVGDIMRLARIYWLKSPLIRRGVNVKADYVFARPVTIASPDEDVNAVLQTFIDDERNQTEFTSHASRIQLERELQTDGNLFFAMLPNAETGRIRIKTLPADEITDIITDPNDRHAAQYYKREWLERTTDMATGATKETKRVAFYRDWRYKPDQDRSSIGKAEVIEGVYVYHVKTGGFSNWKFGVSELYAALDWAKAYKTFLENWATIVQAYARFAFKLTTTGGRQGAVNARNRLNTRLGVAGAGATDTNPAPVTGATFIAPEGNDITPIRTSGATTSAEDGRRLLLMVAASFGLPETFFGDVSVGTLATATSLDRPTELMLSNRQQLWRDIYHDIFRFVVEWAIRAPNGPLRGIGSIERNEFGEDEIIYNDDAPKIVITFPSVLEADPQKIIASIKQGATLDGATPNVIPDFRIIARMVLTALGENDIDETIDALFPTDESAKPVAPAPAAPGAPDDGTGNDPAERGTAARSGPPTGARGQSSASPEGEAVREASAALREAITALARTLAPATAESVLNGRARVLEGGSQ